MLFQMIIFSIVAIAWCCLWMGLGLRAVNCPPGTKVDTVVGRLSSLLPPFAIVPCLALSLALPLPASPPSVAIRSLHYFGIILLFLFVLAGAALQVRLWIQIRQRQTLLSIASTYKVFWIVVRLMPAPAAACILISGIRLAYESPYGSITYPWMFWLIVGFSFFFFDGLIFYLPEICYQWKAIQRAVEVGSTLDNFLERHRNPVAELLILAHSLSFPVVFSIASFRSTTLWIPHALIESIVGCFASFEPHQARAGSATALVLSVGVLLLIIRIRRLVAKIKFLNSPAQ